VVGFGGGLSKKPPPRGAGGGGAGGAPHDRASALVVGDWVRADASTLPSPMLRTGEG